MTPGYYERITADIHLNDNGESLLEKGKNKDVHPNYTRFSWISASQLLFFLFSLSLLVWDWNLRTWRPTDQQCAAQISAYCQ
jgi:hypothetical protein